MILKHSMFVLAIFTMIATGCGSDKDQSQKDKKDGVDANSKNDDDPKQAPELTEREKFEKGTIAYLTATEEMNAVLAEITDADSAKKSIPSLEKVSKSGEEVMRHFKSMGQPSKETEEYVKEKYHSRMDKAMGEMMSHLQRLRQNQEVWPIVEDALGKPAQRKR